MNLNSLMVLTSHDKLDNSDRKTGFWLEEFAAPYGPDRNCLNFGAFARWLECCCGVGRTSQQEGLFHEPRESCR
jgi:hypothetical protein